MPEGSLTPDPVWCLALYGDGAVLRMGSTPSRTANVLPPNESTTTRVKIGPVESLDSPCRVTPVNETTFTVRRITAYGSKCVRALNAL